MPATAVVPDPVADIAGLEPVETIRRRWPMILGALVTIAMIVGLGQELLSHGLGGLHRMVPTSPWFYLCFTLLYLMPPFGDLLIFRHLWRIPWGGGFVALNQKRIANDVVLGYSGEAYFYAWARARAHMIAAPFGAVKDVSILSGIAGNGATILLCAIALPLGYQLIPPHILKAVMWSAGATLFISVAIMAFSKRVFSLPRRQLWVIFDIHMARIALTSVLLALCWHFAMPGVSVGMWLFLSAGRLLVSRLPFLPNKDLLFANFAILVVGQDKALSEMIAFTAALTLLVHVVLIVLISLGHAIAKAREWHAAA
ncbi:MAG: hypothetical protein QM688_15400 [Sphingomonas bacterium]